MYSSHVTRFALSVLNDLAVRSRIPEIAVSDFSSGSYATIFGDEVINQSASQDLLNHLGELFDILWCKDIISNCFGNLTD